MRVKEKLLGIPCKGIIGNLFNTISFGIIENWV